MAFDTDFVLEPAGPVEDSPRWDIAFGSGTTWAADAAGTYATGGSTCAVVPTGGRVPSSVWQSVEIRFDFAGSGGCGVLLAYVDADNYVYGWVDHATAEFRLTERVAGVEADLLTVSGAGRLGDAGAIRVELAGTRARGWYEKRPGPVADRPPDGAGDLTGTYAADTPGNWGFIVNGAPKVRHFTARQLPGVVMSPPWLAASDCRTVYELAPVDVSVGSVSSNLHAIEWEVHPQDSDDFQEVYRDFTPPTLTSRIFFLRPGFTYEVRARGVAATDAPEDWVSAEVTVTGVKSTSSPTLADETYPDVTPDYALENAQQAQIGVVVSDTGRERLVSPRARPRNRWSLRYESRTRAELDRVISFFDLMQGQAGEFNWTHPITGATHVCRFGSDELAVNWKDRGDDQIGDCDVELLEVVKGAVSVLSITLTGDTSL